ncbi:signal peptide peptidase SppA [Gammaproteobacteria bacterium]|nr:signal peptide peptidase SppA [Gammaproteobacteria bacterium]
MSSDGIFPRIGRGITKTRNFVVNTIFILILLAIFGSIFNSTESISIPEEAALVLDPSGILVEERTFSNPLDDVWNINYDVPEVEIAELMRAIELAEQDSRIKMIILDLEGLTGISLAQADRIIESLKKFKLTGKPIGSYANSYSQIHYYISSVSDEIYLNPMGSLLLDGFGGRNLYFKDFLDRFGIRANVYRVGEYKEAVEPFLRNDMSEESKTVNLRMLNKLWASLSQEIENNRLLDPGAIDGFGVGFAKELKKTNGDFARAAIENNLVDELLTWDQVRVRFGDRVGLDEEDKVNSVDYRTFLASHPPEVEFDTTKIAVINIQGPIFLGTEGYGSASADVAVQLIREARKSEDVAAIVVRVDSPGGSAFASEMIRLELELAQLDETPVVVSFASVAASGGYWLAATSDYIVAEPNTITGSIGVFSVLFTAQEALDKLGIHSDGIATTPFSLTDPFTSPSDQLDQALQLNVEHGYNQFVELVAKGRDLDKDKVEGLAQGKVWLGSEAIENGLADEAGSLPEALSKAAELANIESWSPMYMKKPVDPRDAFIAELLKSAQIRSILPDYVRRVISLSDIEIIMAQIQKDTKLQALCTFCLSGLR